jgi:hypothetical protein
VTTDRLVELEKLYHEYRQEEGQYIGAYDEVQDGDPRKTEILRQMDAVNQKIRGVEKEIDELLDEDVVA